MPLPDAVGERPEEDPVPAKMPWTFRKSAQSLQILCQLRGIRPADTTSKVASISKAEAIFSNTSSSEGGLRLCARTFEK